MLTSAKRLMEDLSELQRTEGLFSVSAAPLEHNLFIWHANVWGTEGPYEGAVFHLVLKFPKNYPLSPPKVALCSMLTHPNVFSCVICLDMLKETIGEPYTGWSSAYSVVSILLQLQSFFFAENIPQDYGPTLKAEHNSLSVGADINAAKKFRCWDCGHSWDNPSPAKPRMPISGQSCSSADGRVNSIMDKKGSACTDMSEDSSVYMLKYLTVPELYRCCRVCKWWKLLVNGYGIIHRAELRCFFSRVSFESDVLGIGVVKQMHNDRRTLKSLSSELDILSLSAFTKDKLRYSVWGQHFDHFFPLVINKHHGNKALSTIKACIADISPRKEFSPQIALEVLSLLMNKMVVSLFIGGDQSRHASEKALIGYCGCHHMLLFLADKYPELVATANGKVREFVEQRSRRTKGATPDLGRLLVLLTLTDRELGWDSVSIPYLQECLTRSVRWYLKTYPDLEDLSRYEPGLVDYTRNRQVLVATETSRKLLMFQVYFLEIIGRPANTPRDQILKNYNRSYGRPSREMQDNLHRACKEIVKSETWQHYFKWIKVAFPGNRELSKMLVEAVENSATNRYHRKTLRGFKKRRSETPQVAGVRTTRDRGHGSRRHGKRHETDIGSRGHGSRGHGSRGHGSRGRGSRSLRGDFGRYGGHNENRGSSDDSGHGVDKYGFYRYVKDTPRGRKSKRRY